MRSLWPAVAVARQRSPSHAGFAWHAFVIITSLVRVRARFSVSLARVWARFDDDRAGRG